MIDALESLGRIDIELDQEGPRAELQKGAPEKHAVLYNLDRHTVTIDSCLASVCDLPAQLRQFHLKTVGIHLEHTGFHPDG